MSWSGADITYYKRTDGSRGIIRKRYLSVDKRERERLAYMIMAGSGLTPALCSSGEEHADSAYNDIEALEVSECVLDFGVQAQHRVDAGVLLGRIAAYSRAYLDEQGVPNFTLFQRSWSWPDFLNNKIDGWKKNITTLSSVIPDVVLKAALRRCERSVDMMTRGYELSLIHGDYTQQNILWDIEQKSWKAIDFGAALIGDARFDLGKIIWVNGALEDSDALKCFIGAWQDYAHRQVYYEQVMFYAHLHALAAIDWVLCQSAHDRDALTRSADFLRRAVHVLSDARSF
ncbi:aminoglycoside phosphotransferase family protein [Neokomagataea anthophila]|uniref:Phosphotransferase n=1 Tax=Neokomagataea anthophila TaxID=2826925 RepID=A0ABS5E7J1_9PROT|nr:aminoglycoside phosphotransferase family protein [Neokomagataea anthophila]MBR0559867.1 phosphotransferase [Neokomagataea anthophila]